MWQVIGHERAIALLSNSIKTSKISHAYLFAGPRHVGKMTVAMNLAQALNCLGEDKPCGSCASCQRIAEGKHADIQIVGTNGRTEISIDQIREMEHSATLRPFEGLNRVFIIDCAESLSIEAANCLLKTLEEPPPQVQIILLSANERMLLPTIRSRCQKLELRPLPVSLVEETLIDRWEVAPVQAKLLARLSAGCLGWAINALRDNQILNQRSEQLSSLLNLAAGNQTERLSYASLLASQYSKKKGTVKELLHLWVDWWRDLLLICANCRDCVKNIDLEDSLHHEAKLYDLPNIKVFIDNLQQTIDALDHNANPRLALEVLMLNIPQRKER
jgi:DNA polymerase-3 subunit delta'